MVLTIKTFEIPHDGTVRVVDADGNSLIEHTVETGDIWRMCQVKDAPIQDWVRLAISRARATGAPAVFWLDATRAHDAQLIEKVNSYLPGHDTAGLEIHIKSPVEATKFTLARVKDGQEYHFCNRKCTARLPHGPLSHPGIGNQRQNAVHRSPDGWAEDCLRQEPEVPLPSTFSSLIRRDISAGILWENISHWPFHLNIWPKAPIIRVRKCWRMHWM